MAVKGRSSETAGTSLAGVDISEAAAAVAVAAAASAAAAASFAAATRYMAAERVLSGGSDRMTSSSCV